MGLRKPGLLRHLVDVAVVGEVVGGREALREHRAQQVLVGPAARLRERRPQHLVQLLLLQLRWRQRLRLEQLLRRGPLGGVVVQQPAQHRALQRDDTSDWRSRWGVGCSISFASPDTDLLGHFDLLKVVRVRVTCKF